MQVLVVHILFRLSVQVLCVQVLLCVSVQGLCVQVLLRVSLQGLCIMGRLNLYSELQAGACPHYAFVFALLVGSVDKAFEGPFLDLWILQCYLGSMPAYLFLSRERSRDQKP